MTDAEIQSLIDYNVTLAKVQGGSGIGNLADYATENSEHIKQLQNVTADFMNVVLNSAISYNAVTTETAKQSTFTPKEVQ